MIHLSFEKGTVVVKGNVRVPNTTWDARSNCYRGQALNYRDIVDYLQSSKIAFTDNVLDLVPCPDLRSNTELRDYQEKALKAWIKAGYKGTIVLPTGSGKTIVAIKAISHLNQASLVVVPTLDLVEQWRRRLEEEFRVDVGVYGGGEHELKGVTVATYDTAYLRANELGNKFRLVIFDEVHHLPALGYSSIAEMFAAPYRLGLTATYEREDGLHAGLPRLVGGKIFEMGVEKLAGKHLAEYDLQVIPTSLTDEEKREYDEHYNAYLGYLRASKIVLRSQADFQRLIMRSGRDPRARAALLARHRARLVALNSSSKLQALKEILERHDGGRVLIFTEHNELVHRISREFLIPSITHKTPKEEREGNLDSFRTGEYRAIVTSKVLDEGVDVPEANVGVILSGTGSKREYRQRLGRILRKREGKRAVLYEIVSERTTEVRTSKKRHAATKRAGGRDDAA